MDGEDIWGVMIILKANLEFYQQHILSGVGNIFK